jgi:hypothetical protein
MLTLKSYGEANSKKVYIWKRQIKPNLAFTVEGEDGIFYLPVKPMEVAVQSEKYDDSFYFMLDVCRFKPKKANDNVSKAIIKLKEALELLES